MSTSVVDRGKELLGPGFNPDDQHRLLVLRATEPEVHKVLGDTGVLGVYFDGNDYLTSQIRDLAITNPDEIAEAAHERLQRIHRLRTIDILKRFDRLILRSERAIEKLQ